MTTTTMLNEFVFPFAAALISLHLCPYRLSSSFQCSYDSVPMISITGSDVSHDEEGDFMPDIFMLYDKAKHCRGQEIAADWFEQFTSQQSPTNDRQNALYREIIDRKHKKRKAGCNGLDYRTITKCRFLSALNDLEKSGVIQSSLVYGNKRPDAPPVLAIARQLYTWI